MLARVVCAHLAVFDGDGRAIAYADHEERKVENEVHPICRSRIRVDSTGRVPDDLW